MRMVLWYILLADLRTVAPPKIIQLSPGSYRSPSQPAATGYIHPHWCHHGSLGIFAYVVSLKRKRKKQTKKDQVPIFIKSDYWLDIRARKFK